MGQNNKEIILASGSQTRLAMLKNAGLAVRAAPSGVDEDTVKKAAKISGKTVEETARNLARAKAEKVAKDFPEALIIGADQMLECDGAWFDKANDASEAESQLAFLSGKTHRLITATVLIEDAKIVWENVSEAKLTMRALSPGFIKNYVARLGADALSGVGCYQIEGTGSQLFVRIDGDFFVIMGLSLLPLLDALRAQGALEK